MTLFFLFLLLILILSVNGEIYEDKKDILTILSEVGLKTHFGENSGDAKTVTGKNILHD